MSDLPTIHLEQFLGKSALAGHQLVADAQSATVTEQKIPWKGKLVAFLQNIPLLGKLIPPLKQDVITQATFLKALAAQYGEEVTTRVFEKYPIYFQKGNASQVRPLTADIAVAADYAAQQAQMDMPRRN